MLNIQTFDASAGGNVVYKALAHPLAADSIVRLYDRMEGPVALYDPDAIADALMALYPAKIDSVFVHDATLIGHRRVGLMARALTDLSASQCRTVLIASFDDGRIAARIARMVPPGAKVLTLDDARLPDAMLSNRSHYLDKLNFATNFAFFRDAGGLSTRLESVNYWASYGAGPVRLWLRLFAANGEILATWEQPLPEGPGGFSIDSRQVRDRFELEPFTGQLFIHAMGVAGHDVVKYTLDTYASDSGSSLSCTHDANAWPSDRYAGLPAPRPDETVILWLQNSHAAPIPAGEVALDRMGAEEPVTLNQRVGPFATVALDVADYLPGLLWPEQVELRTGRHVVRPRYEVSRHNRIRIAHVNVERDNLQPDPALPSLPHQLGRGYLLPFPILPRDRFRSIFQPTPMATTQRDMPIRLDIFDNDGLKQAELFLGCLPRDCSLAMDLDQFDIESGHAELVYDFRNGGDADGWLHALFRYEDRNSGHVAETSFGAHIFNTAMTYRDEPQSYSGRPPGLSTKLFLKLGDRRRRSFATLIYPASGPWHPVSSTKLDLRDGLGASIATRSLKIACSGSTLVRPDKAFNRVDLDAAGPNGYVLVIDPTCRLFGYQGLMDEAGSFSIDHMFGF